MKENYKFYEIQSAKSKEYKKGLRQVSLVCEDDPDIYCFLWLTAQEELKHLQFLFDEKLIEWFAGKKGFKISQTNRRLQHLQKTGVSKGVRTIHEVRDYSILNEGLGIIKSSHFPNSYKELIHTQLAM